MIEAIGAAFTGVLGYVGEFVGALVGDAGPLKELLPVFAIGIGVSVLMLAIKTVKGMTWGA